MKTEEQRALERAWSKARHWRRTAQGLCIRCWEPAAVANGVRRLQCDRHLEICRRYDRARRLRRKGQAS